MIVVCLGVEFEVIFLFVKWELCDVDLIGVFEYFWGNLFYFVFVIYDDVWMVGFVKVIVCIVKKY